MIYHCYDLAGRYVGDVMGTLPPQAMVRGVTGVVYAWDAGRQGYAQYVYPVPLEHAAQLDHDPKKE